MQCILKGLQRARRQFELISLEHWNPLLISCSLMSHVFIISTMIFLDHIFRSMVRADLASKNASSLLCSVRHVLHGLCDGDLVLDREQSIVDGAACLQRHWEPLKGRRAVCLGLLKTQRKCLARGMHVRDLRRSRKPRLQDTNFLEALLAGG